MSKKIDIKQLLKLILFIKQEFFAITHKKNVCTI